MTQLLIGALGVGLLLALLLFDHSPDRSELVGSWRYQDPDTFQLYFKPLPHVDVIELEVGQSGDDFVVRSLRIEALCLLRDGLRAAAWVVPGPFSIGEDGTFTARWMDELGESVVSGTFSDDRELKISADVLSSSFSAICRR